MELLPESEALEALLSHMADIDPSNSTTSQPKNPPAETSADGVE